MTDDAARAPEERIRIVLADDDAMVREGVRAILSADAAMEVVAEADNGRSAVDTVRQHRPDVVLLDIRMPVLDGLSAIASIREAVPETAVIILTTFSAGEYVARAVADGAAGFVLKAGAPRELIMGVRACADGAAYFSPPVTRWLVEQAGPDRIARQHRAQDVIAGLSERQREVLAEMGRGRSNAQIARALHLVEGTVKGYVSTIMSELGSENRVQAALVAHEAGLTRDPG
ncbi:MAG TPA: response regulator transcription factor [Nocardioidaceae bacterium]|nr:response regulator transcription factor [Nocardioidaceae bacterium]